MALTQKRLIGPSVLTNSTVDQYITPANTTAIFKQILFVNKTGSAATVTLRLVPTGSTESNNHDIFSSVNINANETISFACSLVLIAGDKITSFASANSSINITASGYEEV